MEAKFFNMEVKEDGDDIVIRIHRKAKGRPSQSQKTTTIATTGKPKEFICDDGTAVMLGVNCFQYPNQ